MPRDGGRGFRAVSHSTAARMVGWGPKEKREKDDFYPTPPDGTRALLRVEKFSGAIWEPACGQGDISRELESAGYEVVSTDLVDRGYGTPRVDFLMEHQARAPNIVTNPPFKMGEDFARRAIALTTGKVCLLLRLAFLEGIERRELFNSTPLCRVWVFSRRLTMTSGSLNGTKGGMIAFAWFVWEHGYTGKPSVGWL